MKIIPADVTDVWILEPKVFTDHRGFFMETYSTKVFSELGIEGDFVQDNHSYSKYKGTLRGIHCQTEPMAQSKLVRAIRGAVRDLAIDLRKGSPTYLRWAFTELSAENKRMLYIPRGFGHAFLTLTDDAEICYKVDNLYSGEHDRTIRYDDPQLQIDWGIDMPVLSAKDAAAPLLADSDINFLFRG